MSLFRFDRVEILLAESSLQVRSGLRGTLRNQGFQVIIKLEELRHWIKADGPDLIIADADLPGGDVCSLFHDIRHHRIGNDPFVPIIATSWSRGMSKVRQVIDSGADDLLIKPINTNELLKRIKRLVRARKSFVVTSDYIGPDRRENARMESSDVPLFDVPNKLQVKATGNGLVNTPTFQKTIDIAIAGINERKMTCHAQQLVYLAEHIVAPFHKGLAGDHLYEQVDRAAYVATDLARRMEGTRFSHVSELCASLLRVINSIRSAGDKPAIKDLDLLLELSRATEMALSSDEKVVALAHDITDSVDSAVAG